ncbi:MAG TPA: pantetheine-phosphate adenylyltransferase [Candidatus Limisoma gallistercoris]|nr:pantetheine-phosphate adenylyltransferase [Candidatus Limisoma gallistercoris]
MDKMIALFPGSFDPYTIGHYSIVERALPLFDKIVIAVGVNRNKQSLMSEEKRVEAIRSLYEDNDKVEVISYDGLTVDAAKKYGARFLLRGVRQVADFEYERNLAEVNRNISGLETILLYTLPEYAHISSSIVRELASYGKDVANLLPPGMRLPKKHE